jgi:hypothetical protein
MKDLKETVAEIRVICEANPVMEERIPALKQVGYENIEYVYLKGSEVVIPSPYSGLYEARHLPKKNLYRIQIGYTELKKGYPAAWCIELSGVDVQYVVEQPF